MQFGEAVTEFEEFYSEAYYEEIAEALKQSKDALVIDFQKLDRFNFDLTRFLKDNPQEAIEAAEEALLGVDAQEAEELEIRINNMPEEDFVLLRNLRSQHIGKFIPVEGMIKRASQVKPEVVSATFECVQCGDLYEKEQDSSKLKSPYKCDCGSRKFEVHEKHMTDTQNIIIEENPESREGSEQPTNLSVRLEGELVDPDFQKQVIPGNVAHITGVLKEKPFKKNSKKYDIYLEANHLEPTQQEFEQLELSEEEIREIKEMAENPKIFQRIVNSIAPSIYGHSEIKKAIALQLFGGVKKTREDGVKSRGDLHILLIGEPGTGKCVSPDTKILLSDGQKKKIGELVEDKIKRSENIKEVDDGYYIEEEIETIGIDEEGQIEEKVSSKMWKREAPEKMYRIKTSSGREVEVTPSHPLFIQKHGNIAPVKAEELEEGTFIAAPRKLDIDGNDELRVDYRKSKANNAIRLSPIEELNPGFCRLVGYIIAEGYIQRRKGNSGTIYITNNDEEILEDVVKQLEKLNVNYAERKSHPGKDAREIHCSSSELISFLVNLEPSIVEKSRDKKFPGIMMSASEEPLRNFIKAFIEAEGTVSKKEREIAVGSTSKELLEDLKTSLLRFNIQSQFRPRKGSYRLRISGKDFEKYKQRIGFITKRKIDQTENFNSNFNTNTDVVPNLGELLRDTREKLGLTQFDFPISRGAYQHYERLDRNPTINKLEKITETFEKRIETLEKMSKELQNATWDEIRHIRKELNISQNQLAANTEVTPSTIGNYEMKKYKNSNRKALEDAKAHLQTEIKHKKKTRHQIQKINNLIQSDIFWDKIEEIEEIKPEYNFVYDLEIPEQHNYLTNGLISHNSQLLKFTGELAPKGRYVVGKSSSGAGLTASVVKDESTGEFSLEAGAVVLAHKGMAAIDEIDKMSAEDRSSLHEAMEQQCFAPDSIVTLADGSRKEISNIVDELIEEKDSRTQSDGREVVELQDELQVIGTKLDDDIETKPVNVKMAGRRKVEEKVVEIELETNRELEVTEDHPFFVLEDGKISTKQASELEEKSFVLAPRKMPITGEEQDLSDIEVDQTRKKVKLPVHNSPALAKFVGYQVSDGGYEMNRGKKNGFNFTNKNDDLVDDYVESVNELFEIEPYTRERRENQKEVRYISESLKNWLEELGAILKKGTSKKIPERLLKCRKDELSLLLRAFFDGDGGLYQTSRGYRLRAVVENRELLEQIQDILLRFGIHSTLVEDNNVWRIEISRYQDIKKFDQHIGFLSEEKEEKLREALEVKRDSREYVPGISDELMRLMQKTGVNQRKLLGSSNVSSGQNISRIKALKVLRKIENNLNQLKEEKLAEDIEKLRDIREKYGISQRQLAEKIDVSTSSLAHWEKNGTERTKEYLEALEQCIENILSEEKQVRKLINIIENLRFVKVREKESKEPDYDYVYDLTVPETDNFVVENTIAHNSISVSKANIQARLNAQTSILAAGNPKLGRFDPYEPIPEQISIGDTLLSRFDFIFPVKDEPDEERDQKLATQILQNHIEPEETEAEISQDKLRKYIAYAKRNVRPDLTDEAAQKIQEFYIGMRSKGGGEDGGSVPITARQLEALIRIAEASARAELRDEVLEKDSQRAIDILKHCLEEVGVDPETGDFDIDMIESGVSSSQRNRLQAIKQLIESTAESDGSTPVDEVIEQAEEQGIKEEKAEEIIEKLKREGELFEPKQGYVQKI